MATTDIFPVGVQAPGNNLAIWLKTAPADPAKPTVAELTGTGALDISCYLKQDAFDNLDLSQDTEDDTRFCDASKREAFGQSSFDLKEIEHIVDQQSAGTEPGNMAKGQIEANSTGYLYLRLGKPQKTPIAAADVVDGFIVTTGEAFTKPIGTGKYYRKVMTSMTRICDSYSLAA